MKMCDECKHFSYVEVRTMLLPFPSCSHPSGWRGVQAEAIGFPLRVDWARGVTASCGEDGRNWEPAELSVFTGKASEGEGLRL